MASRRKQGFTLIELLVVTAIMAALAAILFPVFAQARARARAASCLSNLKQIGMASLIYAQDYDETFLWDPVVDAFHGKVWFLPHSPSDCPDRPVYPWSLLPATPFWADLLQPYLHNSRVFHCPDFPGYQSNWAPGYERFGYDLNGMLAGDVCGARTIPSLKSSASEVGLFADTECADTWGSPLSTTDGGPAEPHWRWIERNPLLDPVRQPWFCIGRRHLGGNNMVYVDGHAQLIHPVQTIQDHEWKEGYFPTAGME
jgi:prepilin-type N-terminal cleavage/methylation domain-containing protein/prepilin-type processing-associated H-X9-DG protein